MRKEYSKPLIHRQIIQLGVFGNYCRPPDDHDGVKPKPISIIQGLPMTMD